MQKAETSTSELHTIMVKVLESNQDLATRIKGLERQASFIPQSVKESEWSGEGSAIDRTKMSRRASYAGEGDLGRAFERELESSRVYNKKHHRHSLSSMTSTAIYTTALSILSNLSLSQVSNISFYAIPIYPADLCDDYPYIFGEKGAIQAASGLSESNSYEKTDLPPIAEIVAQSLEPPSMLPSSPRFLKPRQLLGRFAKGRRIPRSQSCDSISLPYNFSHKIHVEMDDETGEFSVCLVEFQNIGFIIFT